MSHETNTYSPVITDLSRFSDGAERPLEGRQALDTFRGTASPLGGFIDVCEKDGCEILMAVAGGAPPSGPVEDDAYEYLADKILSALNQGCDAVMLDLHGAMVSRSFDDGEGELLRRIRSLAPEVPIALCLDMHANLFPDMVRFSTLLCGYHTYPHVDMDDTARRAGRLLLRTLKGEIHPVVRWGNAPMLPHVMRQGTDDSPNRELQQRAIEMEQNEALDVSLFTVFPHADIYNAGLSVAVVTDANPELAEDLKNELLDSAWQHRQAFVYHAEPLSTSVARAAELARKAPQNESRKPILLLDHYDNTASGGTMDTTEVLTEILRQGLEDVAVFGIFDPAAVEQMVAAGLGNDVSLELGGKLPMPALRQQSRPLPIKGRVTHISDGRFPATVAMSRGLTLNMGKTAVLSVPGAAGNPAEGLEIVVISRHLEPFDPGCFKALGIDLDKRRFLMLKSRIHYRVGFQDRVSAVVECAGRGVCTSDYSELDFLKVRRPVYPLDDMTSRNDR